MERHDKLYVVAAIDFIVPLVKLSASSKSNPNQIRREKIVHDPSECTLSLRFIRGENHGAVHGCLKPVQEPIQPEQFEVKQRRKRCKRLREDQAERDKKPIREAHILLKHPTGSPEPIPKRLSDNKRCGIHGNFSFFEI